MGSRGEEREGKERRNGKGREGELGDLLLRDGDGKGRKAKMRQGKGERKRIRGTQKGGEERSLLYQLKIVPAPLRRISLSID